MKLQIHPFVDAQAANFFDVAGTRSERQPVQNLQDLLIFGEFGVEAPAGLRASGHAEQHANNAAGAMIASARRFIVTPPASGHPLRTA